MKKKVLSSFLAISLMLNMSQVTVLAADSNRTTGDFLTVSESSLLDTHTDETVTEDNDEEETESIAASESSVESVEETNEEENSETQATKEETEEESFEKTETADLSITESVEEETDSYSASIQALSEEEISGGVKLSDLVSETVLGTLMESEEVTLLSDDEICYMSEQDRTNYVKMCEDIAELVQTPGYENIVISYENQTLSCCFDVDSELFTENLYEYSANVLEESEIDSEDKTQTLTSASEEDDNGELIYEGDMAEIRSKLPEEDFFREQLEWQAQEIYDALKSQVSMEHPSADFDLVSYDSLEDAVRIIDDATSAYFTNTPNDKDWISRTSYTYSIRYEYVQKPDQLTDTVMQCRQTFTKSQFVDENLIKEVEEKVEQIYRKAEIFVKNKYPNRPTYGFVKYFDKWLCENVYYDKLRGTEKKDTKYYQYNHSSVGALLKGYAVCESYARAMEKLLTRAGIPNMFVVGKVRDGGGHAWNYVQMPNEKWYLLDTTWNDPTDTTATSSMKYFLIPKTDLHIPIGKIFIAGKKFKFPQTAAQKYDPVNERQEDELWPHETTEMDLQIVGTRLLGLSPVGRMRPRVVLKVPDYIESIEDGAFDSCQNIEAIQFAEKGKLKKIGDRAFASINLEEVNLPESLETIGSYAFANNKLGRVWIREKITQIGTLAFSNNEEMERVDIDGTFQVTPDTYIDDGNGGTIAAVSQSIFAGNPIRIVNIEEGVEALPEKLFSNVLVENQTIRIPVGVKTLGAGCFEKSIDTTQGEQYEPTVTVILPSTVTSFDSAFVGNGVKIQAIYESPAAKLLAQQKYPYYEIINKITYECNGGINDASNPVSFDYLGSKPILPATRSGYTFKGWYLNADFSGREINNIISLRESVTLYAKWEMNQQTPNPGGGDHGGNGGNGGDGGGTSVENGFTVEGIKSMNYYTGKPVVFNDLAVYYQEKELRKGIDYSVTYVNNVKVSTRQSAKIIIEGKGNYKGKVVKYFNISKRTEMKDCVNIKNAKVQNFTKQFCYDGTEKTQEATLTVNGNVLVKDEDYTEAYSNNIDAGTATVIYMGCGNYTGTIARTFQITKYPIKGEAITYRILNDTYNVPFSRSGAKPEVEVLFNGKVLREGSDYTLTYSGNMKVDGNASFTVNGRGNFKGTSDQSSRFERSYQVVAQDLSKANIEVRVPDVVYKVKNNIYRSVPTLWENGKKLIPNKDYATNFEYTYVNDTNVRTKTPGVAGISVETRLAKAGTPVDKFDVIPVDTEIRVTIHAKGNYGANENATVSGTFRITRKSIANAKVTHVLSNTIYPYTGEPVTLRKDAIRVKVNGVFLSSKDYDIIGYRNNINKGTATAILQGKGNYGQYVEFQYKISPAVVR